MVHEEQNLMQGMSIGLLAKHRDLDDCLLKRISIMSRVRIMAHIQWGDQV
jgi:hypothetical protein